MNKGADNKKEKILKNKKGLRDIMVNSSPCKDPVSGSMQWSSSYVVPLRPEFSFSATVPPQNLVFQEFLGGPLPRYSDAAPTTSNHSTASMTIFYSGAVHLFHDVSPEKAQLTLEMARQGKTNKIDETIKNNGQTEREIDIQKSQTSHQNFTPSNNLPKFYAKGALAMARKATLARFLEKRKHRLIYGASPYFHINKSSKSPQEHKFMHQQEEETSSSGFDLESRCSTSFS